MPVGNYPIWKDKKQTIKHPASGLSKNKYDAKGNLRPQRKSRAKAEKPEGQIKDRNTGEIRDRIRAERSDVDISHKTKRAVALDNLTASVTTKLPPLSYMTEFGESLADANADNETLSVGSKVYQTYDGGRYRENPDERLKLLPPNVPYAHMPHNPYPELFGEYGDSDKDAEFVNSIGGFSSVESEGPSNDAIYAKQRAIGDAFIKKMAFDGDRELGWVLRRTPTFNVAFTDNDTPYFYDPNNSVLPKLKMNFKISLPDGRVLNSKQHQQEKAFLANAKSNYIEPHNKYGDKGDPTNQHREDRIKHWGEEYGRGLYREKWDMKKDNVDIEGRPRFLYKGLGKGDKRGKYRSEYKFIHYGDVPPASIDPPFLGMNKQDIVDIDGNPLYAQQESMGSMYNGNKNTRYIKLMDYARDFDSEGDEWRLMNVLPQPDIESDSHYLVMGKH